MNNSRGMSLIETVVGIALLGIVSFLSLSTYQVIVRSQILSEKNLNVVLARNLLISYILDRRTWSPTVSASENLSLSCMYAQDQVAIGSRNCKATLPGPINLYAINNQVVFALQQSNVGLDMNGQLCNSFQASPGSGNASCPIGINFSITPQCDQMLASCFNPPYLIQGQFTRNGGDSSQVLNLAPYNFSILESGFYCPQQVPTVALTGDPSIVVNPTQVFGITNPTQLGHFASTNPLILPCRSIVIDFKIDTENYDNTQANNQTNICLADESLARCGIAFVHKVLPDGSYSFDLMEDATLVATKPTWMNLSGTETFEFNITNGLVKFCVDSHCLHLFEQKLEGPSRLRLYPGWVSAPGLPIVDRFFLAFFEL